MKRKTTQSIAEDVAKAHTDLNVFAAVQTLMESSLVSADSYADEARIGKLAQIAQRRCFRRYETAMAKLAIKPE